MLTSHWIWGYHSPNRKIKRINGSTSPAPTILFTKFELGCTGYRFSSIRNEKDCVLSDAIIYIFTSIHSILMGILCLLCLMDMTYE